MLPAAARPAAAAAAAAAATGTTAMCGSSSLLNCRCLRLHRAGHARGLRRAAVVAMARPWRPDMNDVDRLSKGGGAKNRGTGNFNIPHRLNADERPVYEAAKKKGYLQVRGTGYRKGRKGNPLPNIWRQWCDAKGMGCVVIEQDMTGAGRDVVVADLAPLRLIQLAQAVQLCHSIAESAGAVAIPPQQRSLDDVPFNVIPVHLPQTVMQMLYPQQGSAAEGGDPQPLTPEQISAAEMAVMRQGDVVRQLKASGQDNSHPDVQQEVQELLRLKRQLQQLLDKASLLEGPGGVLEADNNSISGSSSNNSDDIRMSDDHSSGGSSSSNSSSSGSSTSSSRRLEEDHPYATAAIWQIPPMPLFYSAERPVAKELAKQLSKALSSVDALSTVHA